MPSVMVYVPIEVEVFYDIQAEPTTYPANQLIHYEALQAECQTMVPYEVAMWAVEQAMDQFERNPRACVKEG